jgi:hypothetical protein
VRNKETEMANTLIRVPITGNAIDIDTVVVPTVAGEIVVLSLEPSVTGKVTIGTSGDGVLITFQKGPHDSGAGIENPPPG